jgi:hypothetical protein
MPKKCQPVMFTHMEHRALASMCFREMTKSSNSNQENPPTSTPVIQTMKTNVKKQWPRFGIAGLALAASIGVSHAYEVIVNPFNSAAEVTPAGTRGFVYNNWNGSPGTVTFDSTKDANGNGASGSMKMQITYHNEAGVATNLGCSFISVAAPMPLRLPNVTAVEFDLMVDPASPLDANGNAFYFQIGFNSPGFAKFAEFWLGPWGRPFTPGVWMHVSNSVPVGTFPAAFVSQLFINPYDDQYPTAKTPIVYIDNIQFHQDTYTNYTAFVFDDPSFLGGTYTNWFGTQTTAVSHDPTNDFYGSASSGSAYIFSPLGANENDSIFIMGFDTNWVATAFNYTGTNVIPGGQFDGVQLDVKWDLANSTVTLSNFNASGDINGIPIGVYDGGINEAFGSTAPSIPNAATNGWVRMFLPLNKTTVAASIIQGLQFKKYGNPAISGVAAYWIDNVIFLGAATTIASPTMSISKPVPGLNLVSTGRSGNNPFDREDLVTFLGNYSFVDQGAAPVTYSIGIASIPPASVGAYRAWIVLDPTLPANAYPDYADANVILLNIQRSGTGSQVIMQAKTNQVNGNGSLALLNSTWTTPSAPEGNWSFTFTQNTNILVRAPNGSTTNLAFPLGFAASDVTTFFGGGSMFALFGGFNNGVGIGQRVVLSSASITNGSGSSANDFSDNFLADAVIQDNTVGGPWAPAAIASYANNPAEAVFLTSPTTIWYVDWSVPAPNFGLQTNSVLNNSAGWGFFGTNQVSQLGNHFHAELDVTNLPPSGRDFFRVKNPYP